MTGMTRWVFPALMLALATVLALWPRGAGLNESPVASSAPPKPDLVELRAEAALRPCPKPTSGTDRNGPLAGVRTTCLGDGASVALGSALAGQTVLINMWAPWCQPCRQELPVLDEYATSATAVPVLTVQVQSDPADGLELLTELSVRLPTVHDGDGAVAKALRAPRYLPVSYVIRADGTARRVEPPTPFTTPDEIQAAVDRTETKGAVR